jgi:hypothetical protein
VPCDCATLLVPSSVPPWQDAPLRSGLLVLRCAMPYDVTLRTLSSYGLAPRPPAGPPLPSASGQPLRSVRPGERKVGHTRRGRKRQLRRRQRRHGGGCWHWARGSAGGDGRGPTHGNKRYGTARLRCRRRMPWGSESRRETRGGGRGSGPGIRAGDQGRGSGPGPRSCMHMRMRAGMCVAVRPVPACACAIPCAPTPRGGTVRCGPQWMRRVG